MTDHSGIVLDNAISPTAFTNDTVFSSYYVSASPSNVISGDKNLLSVNQEVPQCQTPLHCCQPRMAKYCQNKIFDINSMVETVEAKKKRKSPKSNHWRSTRFLQKATLNYFQKLIKDARRGFQSKVENAQLIYSIYGNKLDEVDYQMWLVNAFKLKDRNELIMFLSYLAEDSSVITPSGHNLLSINERELVFNFWKIISEISINISKKNILIRVFDIQDSNTSTVEIKRDYKHIRE